jgi:hypothetical protein
VIYPHVCNYHKRERIGPTSRLRGWLILVDRCACGKYRPVHSVTWDQYTWLRRLMRGAQAKPVAVAEWQPEGDSK